MHLINGDSVLTGESFGEVWDGDSSDNFVDLESPKKYEMMVVQGVGRLQRGEHRLDEFWDVFCALLLLVELWEVQTNRAKN